MPPDALALLRRVEYVVPHTNGSVAMSGWGVRDLARLGSAGAPA